MARTGKVTCPNCKWQIEMITLHRFKVIGVKPPRERDRRKQAPVYDEHTGDRV